MPNIMRNSATSIMPRTGEIRGLCTLTAGSPAVGSLSGTNAQDRAQVSVTDNGTGTFALVVSDFKGPQGLGLGTGTALNSGYTVACSAASYSGNTATYNFTVANSNSQALSDTSFIFDLWAY